MSFFQSSWTSVTCGCSRRTRSTAPAQPRQCTPRSSNVPLCTGACRASVLATAGGSLLAMVTTSSEPCASRRFPRQRLYPSGPHHVSARAVGLRRYRGVIAIGSRGPHPVTDLGRVLQVLPGVGRGPGDRSLQLGDQGRGAVLRPAPRIDALQGVYREVVAAHAVQDNHVEGGCRGALLGEAANVEAVDVDVPVHDLVYRAPVAVEGEDDLLVSGEELDKARLAHAVRVELAQKEGHQVYDVDDADLELWSVLAQPVRRCHGLQGWDV